MTNFRKYNLLVKGCIRSLPLEDITKELNVHEEEVPDCLRPSTFWELEEEEVM